MKAPGHSPAVNLAFAKFRIAPRYVANFDSASSMVRALGRYLRGRDFPGAGIAPTSASLASGLNALPPRVRETLYTWGGWSEAVSPRKLNQVRAEVLSEWIVRSYPRRSYPAVMIGSSSGAAVHLGAALGIPWLPQTLLIPVRRPNIHPDEPRRDLEWAKNPARDLLSANPDLQLHHMHDPNQDRLMIQRMTYFRVKRLCLGETYERFLKETLPPGGIIFILECQRTWPTTRVGDRHFFQFGALGGATPEEFHQGSDRVEAYLSRYGSHRRRWEPPLPDGDRPEAEWGFEPTLRGDIERLAREQGYQIRRVVFKEPEHLSPLVADLYRWWYRQRRLPPNRLFVESFLVLEPWWTLKTGSCPFWMKFNMEPSADWLEEYLDRAEPYDEIFLTLFSHGVECVGLPPLERWRSLLRRGRKRGEFIGVDEEAFPRDFGIFIRYYIDLKKKIPARYPMPGPMAISQLDQFLKETKGRYPVEWIDQNQEPSRIAVGI